jgi:secreted trypsin-like serine protease
LIAACFGDAGSPLFDDVEPRWLVGIATGSSGGCGDNLIPDVYANVASFADWIVDQETDETCDKQCTGCLCDAYEFMGDVTTAVATRMTAFAGGVASFFSV